MQLRKKKRSGCTIRSGGSYIAVLCWIRRIDAFAVDRSRDFKNAPSKFKWAYSFRTDELDMRRDRLIIHRNWNAARLCRTRCECESTCDIVHYARAREQWDRSVRARHRVGFYGFAVAGYGRPSIKCQSDAECAESSAAQQVAATFLAHPRPLGLVGRLNLDHIHIIRWTFESVRGCILLLLFFVCLTDAVYIKA